MKATLEFNLPEERHSFRKASQAEDVFMILFSFDNKLREWAKHGHSFNTADEAVTEIRKYLHDCLREANIDIYE